MPYISWPWHKVQVTPRGQRWKSLRSLNAFCFSFFFLRNSRPSKKVQRARKAGVPDSLASLLLSSKSSSESSLSDAEKKDRKEKKLKLADKTDTDNNEVKCSTKTDGSSTSIEQACAPTQKESGKSDDKKVEDEVKPSDEAKDSSQAVSSEGLKKKQSRLLTLSYLKTRLNTNGIR